ncbi:MAG TPA: hypothetical protein H9870_08435 [Candidatus Corynebacterium avicola]|uniref:Uncharacterized protein n=1 Tax=Candidatus Corynebacterium avicola TaxID=2838527 RepID=A0A9D1RRW4_9CORY|nr:hypothetical protein [Candidatus Corynebacterium avicola]
MSGPGNQGARGTTAMGPMMGGAGRGAGAGAGSHASAHKTGKLSSVLVTRSGTGFTGVRDYFTRQFLGKKPRTVKKTIR